MLKNISSGYEHYERKSNIVAVPNNIEEILNTAIYFLKQDLKACYETYKKASIENKIKLMKQTMIFLINRMINNIENLLVKEEFKKLIEDLIDSYIMEFETSGSIAEFEEEKIYKH